MPIGPEKELFMVDSLHGKSLSRKQFESETEPAEVIQINENCYQFLNQIIFISEAYHLAYGGSKHLLDICPPIIEIETPMKNSVLHIAAWNGNDDIVELLIERAPKLLFELNKNNDSVLDVAARNGRISTIKKLLEGYTDFQRHDIKRAWFKYNERDSDTYDYNEYGDKSNMKDLLNFVKLKNDQGNTMFHEAMLCHKRNIDGDKIFKACEQYKIEGSYEMSLSNNCYNYAIDIVNHEKKTVLYLAVENGNKDAVDVIFDKSRKNDDMPMGLSPLIQNRDIWIHTIDKHGMLPLHYAASIGYLQGVELLLDLCKSCTIQTDKYGYFPIHLASYGGHVEVVKKLLQYCPDPTEMLDTSHKRNILHIAANHGKYEIVCYILQSDIPEHQKLINQKDNNGDTPLHLAARSCHPTTVYYLVNQNNEKVNLNLVNKYNETALDIVNSLYEVEKSSLRQASSSILLQAHKIFISMLVAS